MWVSKHKAMGMGKTLIPRLTLALAAFPLSFSCAMANPTSSPDASTLWEQTFDGSTLITGVGAVKYSMNYRSIGFDHFATEISVSTQQGKPASEGWQLLYEGIHDKPPAKIWGSGRHLCLAMQTCARYSDSCHWQSLAYRFESASQNFVETKSSSRLCRIPRK